MTETTEKLKEYGLDWPILKLPLVAKTDKGNEIDTPYFGLIRQDTQEALFTCKKGYRVVQNHEMLDLVTRAIGNSPLELQSGGAIHGGKRVFLSMEVTGGLYTVGSDKLVPFITVLNGNDGSSGFSIGSGDRLLRNGSMFYRFYRNANFKFKHTKSLDAEIGNLHKKIATALSMQKQQFDVYAKMAETFIDEEEISKLVTKLTGVDQRLSQRKKDDQYSSRKLNIEKAMLLSLEDEINKKGQTAWAVLNGVRKFTNDYRATPKRENGRVESLMKGPGYSENNATFDYLQELLQ